MRYFSAIQFVLETTLIASNGYRNQLSFVVFLSTTSRFVTLNFIVFEMKYFLFYRTSRPLTNSNATLQINTLRNLSSLFGFAYATTTNETYDYLSMIISLSNMNVKRVSDLAWRNVDISGPSFSSFVNFVASSKLLRQTFETIYQKHIAIIFIRISAWQKYNLNIPMPTSSSIPSSSSASLSTTS